LVASKPRLKCPDRPSSQGHEIFAFTLPVTAVVLYICASYEASQGAFAIVSLTALYCPIDSTKGRLMTEAASSLVQPGCVKTVELAEPQLPSAW